MNETIEKRNELIEAYRATNDGDYTERVKIVTELSALFDQRSDWQRRHSRSYRWAMERGVIPRSVRQGMKHGKPALFTSTSDLSRIARARDELHDHCCLKRYGYAQEYFAGEVFTQQVKAGNTIESALECAKQSLALGMAA